MKKLIIIPFLFLLLASFTLAQTVYITKTGSKYHTASCSYLRKSSIIIDLKDAISREYTPCSRCNPPVLKGNAKSTIESNIPKPNKPKIDSTKSSTETFNGKTIYTGPRGGKFYLTLTEIKHT